MKTCGCEIGNQFGDCERQQGGSLYMVLSHYVLGPQFGGNKKKTKEKKNDDVQL